jgi:hypothetical protein
MEYTDRPICTACGGSGSDVDWEAPDLSKAPVDHHDRWLRQFKNRPSILEGYDRFLAMDEAERLNLSSGTNLNSFVFGCLEALGEIANMGNHCRVLSRQERAPLTIEALDGLFIVAAEITHYLSDRGHPLDPSDHTRIGEEQIIMREIEERSRDETPDTDNGPTD